MLCLGIHSNAMLHFMVQALKDPPLCSSTVLSCYPSLCTWGCAQESDQCDTHEQKCFTSIFELFFKYIIDLFSKCPVDVHPQSTYTIYLEYHRVCPLVRIGTLHPLFPEQVCPPRTYEGRHTRLRVRGWEGSNSDDWRKSLALCLLCDVHVDLGHFDMQACRPIHDHKKLVLRVRHTSHNILACS